MIDEALEPDALAGLLALASAAAGGAAVGLLDDAGTLVAGRSPGPVPARVHALVAGGRRMGAIVGDEGVSPELLALIARAVELALGDASSHAEGARVAQELAIGRRIQLSLLPRTFPELPGWTFAAAYEPAREVGGDLFDVFRVRGRDDQVALLVADVTGKGIPAALLMADVRALLHAATDNADGPSDALGRVNRILAEERRTSLFVTATLLVVETATGNLRHASAGHEPALVARAGGGVQTLESGGPILGAFADAVFPECADRLRPGDALIQYTDGVTDTRDPARRFYGDDRLVNAIGTACGWPADGIVRAITEDVHAFRGDAEPFDDLTLLVTERRGA